MGSLPSNPSESFKKANPHLYGYTTFNHSSPGPEPEQALRHDALGTTPGKGTDPARIVVRIVSYRLQLLDPDNLFGGCKYFIDALRYAGIIPDDRTQDIELRAEQIKVTRKPLERTEVFVESQDPCD